MKTLSELVADARATHDIRDVLGLSGREKVIVCPLPGHVHKHNTPSFSIFTRRGLQWWRCHGSCDLEGDVVDLVGFLRVPGYDKRDPDKIRAAVEMVDSRYQIKIPEPEPETVLAGTEHLKFLPPGPEAVEYAASRGLTVETMEKFRVGQSGHYLTMPCFENKILKGIKMRNMRAVEKNRRFFQLEGSRLGLFNFDNIYLKTGLIYIVKGEIPAMLMDQIGFNLVCAPTGGEASGTKQGVIQRWTEAVALAARIVIGDNDEPGEIAAQKRRMLFGAAIKFPPERFKDLDEWILADKDNAIRTLRDWRNEVNSQWW